MKYYSLYSLLMWIQHEVHTEFDAIIKIYNTIADPDISDEESRELVFSALRESGMIEEGFEASPTPKYEDDIKDIIMPAGTKPAMIMLEMFEFKMQDRVFKIAIYLN